MKQNEQKRILILRDIIILSELLVRPDKIDKVLSGVSLRSFISIVTDNKIVRAVR